MGKGDSRPRLTDPCWMAASLGEGDLEIKSDPPEFNKSGEKSCRSGEDARETRVPSDRRGGCNLSSR